MMPVGDFVIITGPMFGGKTEELLRIAKRYDIAGIPILLFTPKMDTRYGDGVICTHNKQGIPARSIVKFEDVFPHIENYALPVEAIFIDEFQFVKGITIELVRLLQEKYKISVYVSGLILDSFREPFEGIKDILPYAEIKYLKAVCNNCGNFEAEYTYRFSNHGSQVMLGGKDEYCALCKDCYVLKPTKEDIYGNSKG